MIAVRGRVISPWDLSLRAISVGGYLVPKAAVFAATLLLSNQLGVREYGGFEYAISWASVVAVPATFGLTGSIPFFALKDRRPDVLEACFLHGCLLAAVGTLAAFGNYAHVLPPIAYLACLMTVASALQAIFATMAKVEEKPIRASALESGIYLGLLAVVPTIWLGWVSRTLTPVTHWMELYVLALASASALRLRGAVALRAKYREVLHFGFPLIFSALLMLLFINGGRISAGSFISLHATATYAFMWRLAAPVIMLHQILGAFWFRRLYESPPGELDLRFAVVVSLVAAGAGFVFVVSPPLLDGRLSLMHEVRSEQQGAFLAVCAQMVLWVAMASLEGIIVREKRAAALVRLLAVIVGLFFGGVLTAWKLEWLTLARLAHMHLAAMALVVIGQLAILAPFDLRFPKLRATLGGTMALYVGVELTLWLWR